jgi:hypothetical protein
MSSGNSRLAATVLLRLCCVAAVAVCAPAFAGSSTSQSLSIRIVIPPHCMEVLGGDVELERRLLDKRLLCRQVTGEGKPKRVEVAQYASFTQGVANVLHRSGLE